MDNTDKELAAIGYPQHILDGFSNGTLLDLRARFAMNLLLQSSIFNEPGEGRIDAEFVAKTALDVSDAFFKEATARGYVSSLPLDKPLSAELCEQAKRIGAFEAFKQIGAQATIASLQPAVRPAHPNTRLNG